MANKITIPDDPLVAAHWLFSAVQKSTPIVHGDHKKLATLFEFLYDLVGNKFSGSQRKEFERYVQAKLNMNREQWARQTNIAA